MNSDKDRFVSHIIIGSNRGEILYNIRITCPMKESKAYG